MSPRSRLWTRPSCIRYPLSAIRYLSIVPYMPRAPMNRRAWADWAFKKVSRDSRDRPPHRCLDGPSASFTFTYSRRRFIHETLHTAGAHPSPEPSEVSTACDGESFVLSFCARACARPSPFGRSAVSSFGRTEARSGLVGWAAFHGPMLHRRGPVPQALSSSTPRPSPFAAVPSCASPRITLHPYSPTYIFLLPCARHINP